MSKEYDYNSIERPYNNNLERSEGGIVASVSDLGEFGSSTVVSGENTSTLSSASTTETSSTPEATITSGQSLDNLWINSWIKSKNYKPKSYGFLIDGQAGYIEANEIYIVNGGTLGGWQINSTSIYTGTEDHSGYTANAGDVTLYSNGTDASLHFNKAYIDTTGVIYATAAVLDGTSTLGGRLGSTLASAIDSSGHFIDTNLNTSAKTILTDFTFSPSDYSGAFKTGDITWNTTTGAITGGSGGIFNKSGLIFASSGVATLTLDGTTGNATFAGTLSAASGTLGSITTGLITLDATGYIRAGMTAYNTGTGFWVGYNSTDYKFSIGNSADPENLLLWDGTDLIVNGSSLANETFFGDGSDGTVNINSGTFTSGPITNNVLTRDAFFASLTLSGGNLDTGGFRLFSKSTTINSTYGIHRNGNDGSNGTAGTHGGPAGSGGAGGTALASGSVAGGVAGGGGGGAGDAGTAGADVAKGMGAAGKAGGAGSAGAGGAGGAGGGAGSLTGTVFNYPRSFVSAYNLFDIFPSDTVVSLKTSAGSGGGGGGGADGIGWVDGGGGGGAGGAGGICPIFSRTIVNNGFISADGGDGGDGGNHDGLCNAGGGGGGGGGSGGVVLLVYSNYSGAGTKTAMGGAGGTGGEGGAGSNGSNGGTGNDGVVIEIEI